MWICKECGEEFLFEAEVIVEVRGGNIDENGELMESLEEFDSSYDGGYVCGGCDSTAEDLDELKEMADWIKED